MQLPLNEAVRVTARSIATEGYTKVVITPLPDARGEGRQNHAIRTFIDGDPTRGPDAFGFSTLVTAAHPECKKTCGFDPETAGSYPVLVEIYNSTDGERWTLQHSAGRPVNGAVLPNHVHSVGGLAVVTFEKLGGEPQI